MFVHFSSILVLLCLSLFNIPARNALNDNYSSILKFNENFDNNTNWLYIDGLLGSDTINNKHIKNNTINTDHNLCNNISTPCKTLSYTLTLALDGYTIFVSNNSLYQCEDNNNGFIIKSAIKFIGFNTTIDCKYYLRGFIFINVPVNMIGFNIINGYTADNQGGSAILAIYNDTNANGFLSDTNNALTQNTFRNHKNRIGSSVNFNYYRNIQNVVHSIKNCLFINNTVSGALNIRFFGNTSNSNSIVVENTQFISNTHTSINSLSDYQGTAAGGVNIVYGSLNYSEIQHNSNNLHSFTNCIFKHNIQSSPIDLNNTQIVSIAAAAGGLNIFTAAFNHSVYLSNNIFEIVNSVFENNTGGNNLCINTLIDVVAFGASSLGINSFAADMNFHEFNNYNFLNSDFLYNNGGEGNASPDSHHSIISDEKTGFVSSAGTVIITDIAWRKESQIFSNTYLFNFTNFNSNIGGNINSSPQNVIPILWYSTSVASAGLVISALGRDLLQKAISVIILILNCQFVNNSGGNQNLNLLSTSLRNSASGANSAAFTIFYGSLLTVPNKEQIQLHHGDLIVNVISSSFSYNSGGNRNCIIDSNDNLSGNTAAMSFASATGILARISPTELNIYKDAILIEDCVFSNNQGGNSNGFTNLPTDFHSIRLTSTAFLMGTTALYKAIIESGLYQILSTSIVNNIGASFFTNQDIQSASTINLMFVNRNNFNIFSNTRFEVDQCNFVNNQLLANAGDVTLSALSSALQIGALSLSKNQIFDMKLLISHSNFTANDAGIIEYVRPGSFASGALSFILSYPIENVLTVTTIQNCIFRRNSISTNTIPELYRVSYSEGLSGAILFSIPSGRYGTQVLITDCELTNNFGGIGGAMQIQNSDFLGVNQITIVNSNISNNYAIIGGGIFIQRTVAMIVSTIFSNNTSLTQGSTTKPILTSFLFRSVVVEL